jgi:NADPH-dependent F420 reductase
MRVAIIGGTGAFGRALATRLRAAGEEVVLGSRDESRAVELAAAYGVEGGRNEDVVRDADIVVLATRSNAALETAELLSGAIGETPLLCVASDLRFEKAGVLPGRLGRSLAEEVADVIEAPVAAGLQSLAAAELMGAESPEQDALVCGDDARAKELSLQLAGHLVAGRTFDAGPLANARALEAMTAVILTLNKRYGGHAGIVVTGLP